MNKKWYRRIMILFSIFMIALLVLQLIAGLLRPASRTARPQPTPVSALVEPAVAASQAPTAPAAGPATVANAPAPTHRPLVGLDALLRRALSPWRPAHIGKS